MTVKTNITEITDKIKLSTFSPKEEETILISIPRYEYDAEEAQEILRIVSEAFPNNAVLLKFDNINFK